MSLDKTSYIRKKTIALLGSPLVNALVSEENTIDDAVELATVRYWLAFPITKTCTLNFKSNVADYNVSINGIKANLFADADTSLFEKIYFIGISRLQDVTNNSDLEIGNKDYFGFDTVSESITTAIAGMAQATSYEKRVISNTIDDMNYGETEYIYDTINNTIKFITPPYDGQLHLWYSWGINYPCLDYMPNYLINVFAMMVAIEFLDMVIAARDSVQLSLDYSINISDLQSKRDNLMQKLEEELPDYVLHSFTIA